MREGVFPRLCVSSTCGGGGKTLLALGLCRALGARGEAVKPFKKGPDYIDAAWLGRAAKNPATNLDPFFLEADRLRRLFQKSMLAEKQPALAIIEGNRGLFDGMDASGAVSTSSLARTLACPILLCIDCAKSTRTIAAILRGLVSFEPDLLFGGVILNRIGSSRHERSLREAIGAHVGLPVLGALPRLSTNPLPERHMGIASMGPELAENLEAALDGLGAFVAANTDLGAILEMARGAPSLPRGAQVETVRAPVSGRAAKQGEKTAAPRIGYVHDEALWFYYPENLEALRAAGADLAKLSLVGHGAPNEAAWQNLDGLYLGGGFPEDYANAISASPALGKIAAAIRDGMPVYAECGGLIILCRFLHLHGRRLKMAGVFAAEARWGARPAGLGYVEAEVVKKNPFFPTGLKLRGHEFHYSHCEFPEGNPDFALSLRRGAGLAKQKGHNADGLLRHNAWGAYTHIFAPALPCWAPNFVAAASGYRARKKRRARDGNAAAYPPIAAI